ASKRPLASKPKVSHLPVFKNIWMVQLGTFSKTENAYKLRDKLRADGFDGHTKEVLLGGKKAIRVFTGPFVKKREAEKTKKKLDQKYKVDSRLIFFDA
ncbi:SPOR domain-containing protein, partial [Oleiphilus sp. HI0128]